MWCLDSTLTPSFKTSLLGGCPPCPKMTESVSFCDPSVDAEVVATSGQHDTSRGHRCVADGCLWRWWKRCGPMTVHKWVLSLAVAQFIWLDVAPLKVFLHRVFQARSLKFDRDGFIFSEGLGRTFRSMLLLSTFAMQAVVSKSTDTPDGSLVSLQFSV